jgi:S1-C subfamily serine protease
LFSNLGAGDRFAAYWGKTRPAILGIVVRPLDASEQARYERGVVVDAVASGSPADDAKIAAGDVIVAIGGESIGDPLAMPALVESHAGQSVRIDLVRNGSPLTVTAQLNPSSK